MLRYEPFKFQTTFANLWAKVFPSLLTCKNRIFWLLHTRLLISLITLSNSYKVCIEELITSMTLIQSDSKSKLLKPSCLAKFHFTLVLLSLIYSSIFIWLQSWGKVHTLSCNDVKSSTEKTFPGISFFTTCRVSIC